jgi:hypothetical protein
LSIIDSIVYGIKDFARSDFGPVKYWQEKEERILQVICTG